MNQTVFWGGIVAPLMGFCLARWLVRDLRQGRIEPVLAASLWRLLGRESMTRHDQPVAFRLALALDLMMIAVLLLSPIWAFRQ